MDLVYLYINFFRGIGRGTWRGLAWAGDPLYWVLWGPYIGSSIESYPVLYRDPILLSLSWVVYYPYLGSIDLLSVYRELFYLG